MGFEGGVAFAFKATLKASPGKAMLITLVVSTTVLSTILKIFEWPWGYANDLDWWSGYFTAVWCSVITMTTVGYGDVYAHTFPGRCTSIVISVWGNFIMALLIGSVGDLFELNESEVSTVTHLQQSRLAAQCITSSMRYYHAKKIYLNPAHALLSLRQ